MLKEGEGGGCYIYLLFFCLFWVCTIESDPHVSYAKLQSTVDNSFLQHLAQRENRTNQKWNNLVEKEVHFWKPWGHGRKQV